MQKNPDKLGATEVILADMKRQTLRTSNLVIAEYGLVLFLPIRDQFASNHISAMLKFLHYSLILYFWLFHFFKFSYLIQLFSFKQLC